MLPLRVSEFSIFVVFGLGCVAFDRKQLITAVHQPISYHHSFRHFNLKNEYLVMYLLIVLS